MSQKVSVIARNAGLNTYLACGSHRKMQVIWLGDTRFEPKLANVERSPRHHDRAPSQPLATIEDSKARPFDTGRSRKREHLAKLAHFGRAQQTLNRGGRLDVRDGARGVNFGEPIENVAT